MNRETFLNEFRLALTGEVPLIVIDENVKYYEDYILTETRKGNREEDVIAALGDPRLLAKTVIEVNRQNKDEFSEKSKTDESHNTEEKSKYHSLPGWAVLILIILAAVVICSIVGSVLAVLFPVLIPIICVLLLIRLIKKR